jgi:hypothetical protein
VFTQAGIERAQRSAAELQMFRVAELLYVPSSIGDVEAEQQRRFAAIIDRPRKLAAMQGLSLKCHVLTGRAVPAIVSFIQAHEIDLLVVR